MAVSDITHPLETAARGYVLFSGGLDSMLAVCLLRQQGVRVEGLVFDSPFFKIETAHQSARILDMPLRVVDFTDDILELVKHPLHGFGNAMNPCIDCHASMIRRAGERVRENGWDFVATGEVLDQRPMSQNRKSLDRVARESGCGDMLLRPLSARLLDPTRPELLGKIDRERLLDIHGRTRQRQMKLAEAFGIEEYPAPAGGCRLTEKLFCVKVRDLLEHQGFDNRNDVRRLLLGRHFRLPGGAKCVVGRNAGENRQLQQEALDRDLVLHPVDVPGPTVVIAADAQPDDLELAAALGAGYCDGDGGSVRMRWIRQGRCWRETEVTALPRSQARLWLLT